MPTKLQKKRDAEQDNKQRNEWVEKQTLDNRKRVKENEREDEEMQNKIFEKTLHSIEKIEKPIHKNTFRLPPLYKSKKN